MRMSYRRWALPVGLLVLGSLAWAQTGPSAAPATEPTTNGKPMGRMVTEPNVIGVGGWSEEVDGVRGRLADHAGTAA